MCSCVSIHIGSKMFTSVFVILLYLKAILNYQCSTRKLWRKNRMFGCVKNTDRDLIWKAVVHVHVFYAAIVHLHYGHNGETKYT